jgi:hypothetical protein
MHNMTPMSDAIAVQEPFLALPTLCFDDVLSKHERVEIRMQDTHFEIKKPSDA